MYAYVLVHTLYNTSHLSSHIIHSLIPLHMYTYTGVIPYSGLDLMTNSLLREMASSYYTRHNKEPGGLRAMCFIVFVV